MVWAEEHLKLWFVWNSVGRSLYNHIKSKVFYGRTTYCSNKINCYRSVSTYFQIYLQYYMLYAYKSIWKNAIFYKGSMLNGSQTLHFLHDFLHLDKNCAVGKNLLVRFLYPKNFVLSNIKLWCDPVSQNFIFFHFVQVSGLLWGWLFFVLFWNLAPFFCRRNACSARRVWLALGGTSLGPGTPASALSNRFWIALCDNSGPAWVPRACAVASVDSSCQWAFSGVKKNAWRFQLLPVSLPHSRKNIKLTLANI